jgi:type IV secretory pathway protease TraF
MNPNRRIGLFVAVAAAVVGGLVAVPRRYVVDGVSMGPGLLPGDVVATGWLPGLDRGRPPQRFDRWIMTLPDGSTGLKRVIGLPGERVGIVAGALVIDGRTVLKGPRLLATMGSRVELPPPLPANSGSWSLPPVTVLDDAAFATGEVSRLLLPVGDVGFAAEVTVPAAAGTRAKATAGPLAVTWRLTRPGRYAVVAGRLDGQAVAAAWPLPAGSAAAGVSRSCLPPTPPETWAVARPWPSGEGPRPEDDARSPPLALAVVAAGSPPARIARISLWRDMHYRPAADGVAAWNIRAGEGFVLGDFPSGSRDSRHFGPVAASALRHRIAAVAPVAAERDEPSDPDAHAVLAPSR